MLQLCMWKIYVNILVYSSEVCVIKCIIPEDWSHYIRIKGCGEIEVLSMTSSESKNKFF